MAQHGLSTKAHDQIDVNAYYQRVYKALEKYDGKTVLDIFSGGGRDIKDMYLQLEGNGKFIAIDSEAQRLVDMVSKNFQTALQHGFTYHIVDSQAALDDTLGAGNIAVIQGVFPATPLGNKDQKSDIDLKADFILCNAGIMFTPPQDLAPTLQAMAGLLKSKGELTLRFSGAREDKKQQTGQSYHVHNVETVQHILETHGLNVTRHDNLDDPNGRPFQWADLQAIKP